MKMTPTWKTTHPTSVRNRESDFQRLLRQDNRPGRQEFQRLLNQQTPQRIEGREVRRLTSLPKVRSSGVSINLSGGKKITLDLAPYAVKLVRYSDKRRLVRNILADIGQELGSELARDLAQVGVDPLSIGGLIIPGQLPPDWVPIGSDKFEVPGFVLNADSPTSINNDSFRGLKTTTSIQLIVNNSIDRDWYGTPGFDANPSFWRWWYTDTWPKGTRMDRAFTPKFYPGSSAVPLPVGTPAPDPMVSVEPEGSSSAEPDVTTELVIEMPSGSGDEPPTFYRTGEKKRPLPGVRERKTRQYAVAFNILNGALDHGSEAYEYWEIIRETADIPDSWSHRRAFEYLYNGGWNNIDGSELARQFATNLIVDKVLGPILSSLGKSIRGGLSQTHSQLPNWRLTL